jgi:hypothetical protein
MPLFVLGRSELGCIWRFRATLSPKLVRDATRLAGREPGYAYSASGVRPPGTSPAPPERLVMIERLFAASRGSQPALRGESTLHEWVTQGSVQVGEVWMID